MEENEVLVEEMTGDNQKGKYMTFRLGEKYYGIGISYVSEIIGLQPVTKVPETEDFIIGLINLRGKIIPVIDVRVRFKQEPMEYNDRTCIIVINVKDMLVGLIVEKVAEVVEIHQEDILPPPSATIGHEEKTQNKYVYGIGKVGEEVKLLLDPDKLLKDEEIIILEQAAEETAEEGEE